MANFKKKNKPTKSAFKPFIIKQIKGYIKLGSSVLTGCLTSPNIWIRKTYEGNKTKQDNKTQIVSPGRNNTFDIDVYEIRLHLQSLQNRTTKN